MTVVCLSGAAYTPEICLREALDDVKNIENVAVVAFYRDGTMQTLLSNMDLKKICALSKALELLVFRLLEQCSE